LSSIDRQRIAAVRKLEEMGFTFVSGKWVEPAKDTSAPPHNGEALYELLVKRADELAGCADGSDDARELGATSAAVEAFEEMWWVSGRVDGGKG
jgi:hypothetical protein